MTWWQPCPCTAGSSAHQQQELRRRPSLSVHTQTAYLLPRLDYIHSPQRAQDSAFNRHLNIHGICMAVLVLMYYMRIEANCSWYIPQYHHYCRIEYATNCGVERHFPNGSKNRDHHLSSLRLSVVAGPERRLTEYNGHWPMPIVTSHCLSWGGWFFFPFNIFTSGTVG